MSAWAPPGAVERLEILQGARTVAIVGMSSNPARASYFVATYLVAESTYELYFVNPGESEILGRKCYPTLDALPVTPDIVDVFRRAPDLPAVAEDAVAIRAPVLWFQLGLRHDGAAQHATDAGVRVVQDRCLKIEHARFRGGLHLAGFDTGVISARRRRVL
jgi:predicted CoA-binding protein